MARSRAAARTDQVKILLTGATGFLGSHLIPNLKDRGHHVGCLLRSGSVQQRSRADIETWKVEMNGAGFREALTEFRPDVVVHLAALYVAEHQYEDVDARGCEIVVMPS